MKLKSFLIVIFLMAFGILLVACNSQEISISLDVDFTTVVGEKATLSPEVKGTNKELKLIFESDSPFVAEVSDEGVVTALAAGEAIISVSLEEYPEIESFVKVSVVAKVELEDFAPKSIKISGDNEIKLNTSAKLTATLTPANSNPTLLWSTSNDAVVGVANDGTVFARNYGEAVITVTSAFDENVSAKFTVKVVGEGTEEEVVDSTIEFLLGQLPKYVTKTFTLPTHPSPAIEVAWKTTGGQDRTEYVFATSEDKVDRLTLTVQYGKVEKTHNVTLKLVVDLGNNLHEKIDNITYAINAYMEAVGKNITHDLMLYEKIEDVNISWMSNNDKVITAKGKFIRPHNDAPVKLTAVIGTPTLSNMLTFDVVGKGYSQEEKVDYILNEGVLKSFKNLVTSSNISLPTVDDKFGVKLTWVSDKPEVMNNNGEYVDLDLDKETVVKFTVKLEYEVANFDFEQDVEIEVTLQPLDDIGRAVIEFGQSDFELPAQVVFGAESEFPSQLTNLPTSLDGHEGVTISWYGKDGEFDSDMNVLIPRIQATYTEVYARFSKDGLPDTVVAFPINIGILTGTEDEFAFTARSNAYLGEKHNQKEGMPAQEGGIAGNGGVYVLGFESFYFKSKFDFKLGEESLGERTYYHFFAPGNVKEYTSDHLVEKDGKKYVDASNADALFSPQWGSAARFYINTTDEVIYVKLSEAIKLGSQASGETYTLFAMDANGVVTTGNTSILGSPAEVTEIAIPAGGMLVNPAYLDGNNLRAFGVAGNVIDVIAIEGWEDYSK